MTTTTAIDQYKLKTIFNADETVSHDDGILDRTTWKRDKELGVGSFGEVWREEDTRGQFRAVKAISKFALKSNRIDYERELRVLVEVKDVQSLPRMLLTLHQLTVKKPQYPEFFVVFHGWYEDKHSVYLAMEYVEQGDLRGHMNASGVIDELHAIPIALQILQGLVVLHEKKICHRDLKPQVCLRYQIICLGRFTSEHTN